MGEYALYRGEQVKIGTCEDMYYLRAGQATLVKPVENSLDPVKERDALRFRFPFPDEDAVEPGGFDDHNRGVEIPGWTFPEGYAEHGSVQFVAKPPGYVLSIPCPEQFGQPGMSVELLPADDVQGAVSALRAIHASNTNEIADRLERIGSVHVGRNGFAGGPKVKQQGYRGEPGQLQLRTIVACGACGEKVNLSPEAAADVAKAFVDEAGRQAWRPDLDRVDDANDERRRAFLVAIAERIMAGYR